MGNYWEKCCKRNREKEYQAAIECCIKQCRSGDFHNFDNICHLLDHPTGRQAWGVTTVEYSEWKRLKNEQDEK
jgi:hypothetical protein